MLLTSLDLQPSLCCPSNHKGSGHSKSLTSGVCIDRFNSLLTDRVVDHRTAGRRNFETETDGVDVVFDLFFSGFQGSI